MDHEPFGRMEELAVLRAGQTVSLKCTSKGGNPVPSMTFTKNGVSFGPGPKSFQNTHDFVATPEDNGAVFGCAAQNMADWRADSKTVRLNVLCKYILHVLYIYLTLHTYTAYPANAYVHTYLLLNLLAYPACKLMLTYPSIILYSKLVKF